jgi:hypothetical protein
VRITGSRAIVAHAGGTRIGVSRSRAIGFFARKRRVTDPKLTRNPRSAMAQLSEADYAGNLFRLLAESFEGPAADGASAYLDRGAGLFQTLDSIPADVASGSLSPGASTIAGHAVHLGYYVRVLREFILGREPALDWPGSWRTSRVDAGEWDGIRQDLRREYGELMDTLRGLPGWSDDAIGDSMAILAHTAYHLGAIRQLLLASATIRDSSSAGDPEGV